MSKTTLVQVGDISRSSELPPDTRVALDFGRDAYSAERVRLWRDQRLEIAALLATVRTIREPTVASFVAQGDPTILTVEESPSAEDALECFRPLTRSHLTLELPLRSDHDLCVFKILSSLGVKTRVPFDALVTISDNVRDAMYDAVLRPGRRAPISPFTELQEHFGDAGFEIEQLDYRENDHFVDLRTSAEPRSRSAWDDVYVDQKRVPFLLDLKECAFCEGLLFCHGYIGRAAPSLQPCREMLSEFMELHNLAYARANAAASASMTSRSDPNERSHW